MGIVKLHKQSYSSLLSITYDIQEKINEGRKRLTGKRNEKYENYMEKEEINDIFFLSFLTFSYFRLLFTKHGFYIAHMLGSRECFLLKANLKNINI